MDCFCFAYEYACARLLARVWRKSEIIYGSWRAALAGAPSWCGGGCERALVPPPPPPSSSKLFFVLLAGHSQAHRAQKPLPALPPQTGGLQTTNACLRLLSRWLRLGAPLLVGCARRLRLAVSFAGRRSIGALQAQTERGARNAAQLAAASPFHSAPFFCRLRSALFRSLAYRLQLAAHNLQLAARSLGKRSPRASVRHSLAKAFDKRQCQKLAQLPTARPAAPSNGRSSSRARAPSQNSTQFQSGRRNSCPRALGLSFLSLCLSGFSAFQRAQLLRAGLHSQLSAQSPPRSARSPD